ncbi:MAG TPA: helicase-related protein [Vicinamibacterales bacterium]|nr:helicase-related protein [Vicinamibacterales bacterium]
MHTAVEPGTLVQARGRPWLLRSVVPHADCQELHLEPAAGHPASAGSAVVLLAPFDHLSSRAQPDLVVPASRRAWMAALRIALLGQREPGTLAAAARATLDLLPHQLEPALAIVRHGTRRLLLADAVGLGKTIEAGLVLAELRARSALERALVLAPPGLCDQWSAELSGRFGMEPVVADAAWLRGLRPVLPATVNPWSIPGIRVASIDFAKRPEIRRAIERVHWDAVVIDEAHGAAGDSERRAAAHAFASRARFVLLLTATPHSGDPRAFRALCGIGGLGAPHAGDEAVAADPIVMFRRNRDEAGMASRRRVHLHRVRSSAAELAVRRRLDDYIRMVWARRTGPEGRDARLAMIVLLKRSLSGMEPLRRSLLARLERLGTAPAAEAVQLPLLLDAGQDDADAAPCGVLCAPGLDDESDERRLLRALAECAAFAEPQDSKRRALVRVLERVREPAIVFTEYRDTLTSLQDALGADTAVLHGEMDRFERAEAVSRFGGGRARVLLATDAAGEGLNLQRRCRLVVNLELPWNPMRLEQRAGRVDRIGQTRATHVINLLASGTAESGLLARLATRLHQARTVVGAIEDVLGGGDEGLMAAWLGLRESSGGVPARPAPAGGEALPPAVQRLDLGSAAREVAAHLALQRQLIRGGFTTCVRRPVDAARTGCETTCRASLAATRRRSPRMGASRMAGTLVTAMRRSRLSITAGRTGLLVIFRVRTESHGGLAPFEALVPVFAEGPCPRLPGRRNVRDRASSAMATLVPQMAAAIPTRRAEPARTGTDRDRRIAARTQARKAVQRGLFDRRAEREAEGDEAEAAAPATRSAAAQPPQPVLLLFVTS